jgi:stage V sporulation protein D (sporulation-specific penicillin-binding protein)
VSGNRLLMRRRLALAWFCCLLLVAALLGRLAWVQLVRHDEIATRAEQSWQRDVPVVARRGSILDRNGLELAYNVSSPTVIAIPAQIRDREHTASALAAVLQMNRERVLGLISQRKLMVRMQPQGRKMALAQAAAVRKLALPGIVVAEDNRRYYPFGALAAHMLGFTGIDNQGLTGLEKKYDEGLQGFNGSISYYADARGRVMAGTGEQYVAPQDGLHLQLTVDKTIQTFVERELDQAMLAHQAEQALVIVMDPRTGELLALSSRPTYNPAFYKEVPTEIYNRNLPVWMTYEPGSTFKIITLAAALEEREIKLEERFFDPGYIQVAGARLRCWKRSGHGSETMLEVVQNSCNPGFVVMGQRLGKEKLFDYVKRFGFGKKTGIDLQGEATGILFKPARVGPVELATTSFGQGVSVTPIQQIAAVSAAVNGGVLYEPHVAKAWLRATDGEPLYSFAPKPVRRVISAETSAQVRAALESVVAQGTGRHAFIDGYRVGGKTGTAQKVVNGRYSATEYIVSFVGFAPADDPQLIVYAAVDHPKGIQFGGLIAAPIVKNILQDSLRYLNVPPRSGQLERKYIYGDERFVQVPALTGLTLRDIFEMSLQTLRIEKVGAGTRVIHQAPQPGSKVAEGSTIRIFLAN